MALDYAWREVLGVKQPVIGSSLSNTQKAPSIASSTTSFANIASPQVKQTPQSIATSFADIMKQMNASAPQNIAEAPKAFDPTLGSAFGKDTFANAQEAINKQLKATATGDSTASRLGRASFANLADEGMRQLSQASALQGRGATGQITGDQMKYFSQSVMPQKANLEATLQAQEEQQAAAERQSGISNLYNYEGLANQAKQFASTQDFNIWAAKNQLSEAERDRVLSLATQDIQNKFDQGERLAGQEFSLYSDNLKMKYDAMQAELDRKAQAGIVDKQLEAEMAKLEKQQRLSQLQFSAQLAQDYDIAAQNLGIDKEKLALSQKQLENDIMLQWQQFGLDSRAFENQDVRNKIEMASIISELDDSRESQQLAADMIYNALANAGYVPAQRPVEIDPTTGQPVLSAGAVAIDPKTGAITGNVDGIDLSKWNPSATDINTAEKLASSGDWDLISEAKGIPDLKNAGIDEMSLDGDRVTINDKEIVNYILKSMYKKDGYSVIADTSKRTILNINGVPYMAVPTEGKILQYSPAGYYDNMGESIRMVALDGSGQSRILKFNVPNMGESNVSKIFEQ